MTPLSISVAGLIYTLALSVDIFTPFDCFETSILSILSYHNKNSLTTEIFSTNIGYFMKERLIIIVLAVISGLIITTVAFFIYQNFISNSNTAADSTKKTQITPQPTEKELLEILE